MDNAMIGKIEKAKRYASEKHRIQFQSFTAIVEGDNSTHTVTYEDGQLKSDDDFFSVNGFSASTMTIERILEGMIAPPSYTESNFHTDSRMIGKVEKAKRYASEKERIKFTAFVATVQGDNNAYVVKYQDGKFESENAFFKKHGYSAHTMTMERILEGMIPSPANMTV